jgi:hypothetical protein
MGMTALSILMLVFLFCNYFRLVALLLPKIITVHPLDFIII